MDGEVDEAALQRRVLARLQAAPCTVQELVCTLEVSERAVGTQLGSLVAAGMVEEAPNGIEGTAPVYRPVQQRRRRSAAGRSRQGGNGGLHSPAGNQQGAVQHGFLPGMLPYHPGPQGFYSPQVLYYPAGMATYQQGPMGAGTGAPQWAAVRGPGMPGAPPRQQGGGGMPMPAPAGGYPHPMQGPYFFAAGPGGMPMAPLTPASSGSQQRQVPMTRSGSSASASSTGWGGVPLSQSAAEVVAAGLVPSPRSSPRSHAADGRGLGSAADEAVVAAPGGAASSSAAPAAPGRHAVPSTSQAAAAGGAEPEGEASKPESASQADPSSSGSDDLSDERPQGAGPSSSGGEGGSSGGARSSPGGSSSSRRSRGNRERQECSFYLKTGTCAYGDSCKFAHPFDKAPRVEFNSLGLPLRPGEPECSFYLKHYRCAFGHTCKFHHPEMQSPPATAMPVFQVHQYAVHQYPQASNTPMLSSLLGLHGHKGPAGGSAAQGAAMQAHGMAANQHGGMGAAAFFMPPHFAGGPHPGFAGMPPGLHTLVTNSSARSSQQRGASAGGSNSSSSRPAASGAAATAATALPLPLPAVLPGSSPGSTGGDAALQAALPEQQQLHIVATAVGCSPPAAAAVEDATAAAGASMEPAGGIACSPTLPPPIMVFHSPRHAAGLAASLKRLQLSGSAEEEVPEAQCTDVPAEPAGPTAVDSSSSGGSGGSLGSLAHQQPRAELATA